MDCFAVSIHRHLVSIPVRLRPELILHSSVPFWPWSSSGTRHGATIKGSPSLVRGLAPTGPAAKSRSCNRLCYAVFAPSRYPEQRQWDDPAANRRRLYQSGSQTRPEDRDPMLSLSRTDCAFDETVPPRTYFAMPAKITQTPICQIWCITRYPRYKRGLTLRRM